MKSGRFLSIFLAIVFCLSVKTTADASFSLNSSPPPPPAPPVVNKPALAPAVPSHVTHWQPVAPATAPAVIKTAPVIAATPQQAAPVKKPVVTASAARPAPQAAAGAIDAPTAYSDEPVARVVVQKAARKMYLLDKHDQIVREYTVELGFDPDGPKREQGDRRTPEGHYTISARNENSHYYKSLRISYPSAREIQSARKRGVDPGGDIFIHGKPNGKSWMWWKYGKGRDWTNGCIALQDDEISEVWNLVPDGTPIDITP